MDEETLTGLIFDVERFAVHDGPGIRTAVFLKGCPLGCLWCHNPESQRHTPELAYFPRECLADCERCLTICPRAALAAVPVPTGRGIAILRERCDLCLDCVRACPSEALQVVGHWLSVAETLAVVKRSQSFYRHSGGGVTVTGGEPLAQWQFVQALLRGCRDAGIHTALDTCGFGPWWHLQALLQHTDLLLYDLKEMDPVRHERFTGVPNDLILENLRRAGQTGMPIAVRVPLVPDYTSTRANARAIGEFAARLPGLVHVELLPYHRLGETKYRWLERGYALDGLRPPPEAEVEEYRQLLEAMGLRVQVGG